MCARLRLQYNKEILEKLLGAIQFIDELSNDTNLPPTAMASIVAKDKNGLLKSRQAAFGLIPSWAKDLKMSYSTFNARSETLESKPVFKNAFLKRHCIIPCSGFYEWREENGKKQPYLFERTDNELIMLAGIWERYVKDDKDLYSFSIITTSPNEFMADYHNRMPVVLSNDNYEAWLANIAAKELLKPLSSNLFKATPMNPAMNKPQFKDVRSV